MCVGKSGHERVKNDIYRISSTIEPCRKNRYRQVFKLIIEAYCCSEGIEQVQAITSTSAKGAIAVTGMVHLWQVSANGSTN